MRVLHFADLHLDTQFGWAPPDVARARRSALRQVLARICAVAAERAVDALTCGGDLYEQDRFTPDTAAAIRSCFASLHPIPVLLAPGNHDWLGPASIYSRLDWSPNVTVFRSSRLSPVSLADGLTVWGAAHTVPAGTAGFLDGFSVDRGGVHVAVFHGSEQRGLPRQGEGKAPHAPFRAEEVRSTGLHHALLGHYHLPEDAEAHTYPGNPDPLSFGETGERAAVLVTIGADGTVARERIPVATSLVSDVVVDLSGAGHSGEVAERVLEAVAQLSGIVRVTLTGEIAPDADLAKQDLVSLTAPNLDALVVRARNLTVGYDIDRLKGEETVRGRFVRDVLAAGLEERQCQRVLVTGLRALDPRRGDLEVH